MGTIHRNLFWASTHLQPEHYDPCPRYLFARAFVCPSFCRQTCFATISSRYHMLIHHAELTRFMRDQYQPISASLSLEQTKLIAAEISD